MTIRLIDTEDVKRFEREVETYDMRVKDRMDNPGATGEWPTYPKAPEPLANSRDKGLPQGDQQCHPSSAPGQPFPLVGRDLSYFNPLDFDGTSQSEVQGYESRWQRNDRDGDIFSTDSTPFKAKE